MTESSVSVGTRILTIVGAGTVIAGAISVYFRTQRGTGPTKIDTADLAVLLILALAGVASILASRNWRIAPWLGAIGVLGWAILIGPAGDMSCTDCGFALLVPIGAVGLQVLLILLAILVPSLRD